MYSKDEQKFMELSAQFRQELAEVYQQIDRLEERKEQLEKLLDGEFEMAEENEEPKDVVPSLDKEHQQAWDDANLINLVDFLKKNPGWSRAELQEGWGTPNLERSDLKRLLEKGKRRGVIRNEGRGRASVWYAVK